MCDEKSNLQDQEMKFIPESREEATRTQDNWVDRNLRMVCDKCIYFVEKKTGQIQRADHVIGRCRRHAPTMSGWPVMYSSDWCGEYKIDENK